MIKKIISRIENLERLTQAHNQLGADILKEATAIRKELRGGSLSSPERGKNQKAIDYVLNNRLKTINNG